MAESEVPLGFGGLVGPPGTHIASFYRSLSELRGVVVPFTRKGLERGDRCLCVIEEETRDELNGLLQGQGVDVEGALASGQLSILSAEESYLSEGYFDPEKMVELYEEALCTAIGEGYRMVRTTGEMAWGLRDWPGVERLMEYEAKLHKMLVSYPQVTICQYNITRFRGDMVMDSLRVHPVCILGGLLIRNHFYLPPDDFLRHLEGRKH